MLEAADRRLFLDALKPPDGYSFSLGVGTTFSLDLVALLAAPLAFTMFNWRDEQQGPPTDGLAILEALRRHIDRLVVFCQAGQIAVPRQHRPLFDFLEQTVVEVSLGPEKGVFHPKVWALRFEPQSSDQPVIYRVLCMSRNLTFDRSWDTMLALEGPLVERTNAFSVNRPLSEFLAALPGLAKGDVAAEAREIVGRVSDEVLRVRFEVPQPFDGFRFVPLGLSRRTAWPFPEKPSRALVVSPFLGATVLQDLAKGSGEHVLVGRTEELAGVPNETRGRFTEVLELMDAAVPEIEDEGEAQPSEQTGLSGLHAKLYVLEEGWNARLWAGSANATWSAFNRNVEFLVELSGRRSQMGVDAVLGSVDTGLRRLLRRFEADEAVPADPVQADLDDALRAMRRNLGAAEFAAVVGAKDGEGQFGLTLEWRAEAALVLPEGDKVVCWPISLKPSRALDLGGGETRLDFGPVSFEALTSFFAFEARVKRGGKNASTRFVLNVALEGAPAGRREAVLRSLLRRPEDVLRFLLLLLSDDPFELLGVGTATVEENGSPLASLGLGSSALFEALLRALARHPEKLEDVAHVITDLRKAGEQDDPLPAEFDAIWRPIWDAHQETAGRPVALEQP